MCMFQSHNGMWLYIGITWDMVECDMCTCMRTCAFMCGVMHAGILCVRSCSISIYLLYLESSLPKRPWIWHRQQQTYSESDWVCHMWNYWEHAWFYNSFCHCLPELQRWGNSSVEGESGRERHVVRNDPGRHRVGTKDFWDCHPWWTQRASTGRSQGQINRGEAPPWLCWEGTLAHKVFSCLHSRLKNIESGISLIWHFAFTFCDVKQILHHCLAVQFWQWTFSTSRHLWPTRTWTSTTRHFDACTCNDAFRWTWTFLSQIPLQKHCHFKQCGVDRQKNDQKTREAGEPKKQNDSKQMGLYNDGLLAPPFLPLPTTFYNVRWWRHALATSRFFPLICGHSLRRWRHCGPKESRREETRR